MCRKLFFLISFLAVLGLVNGALAYEPGIILQCDAGGEDANDYPLQAGWDLVVAGINVNVNGTGINAKLETGLPDAIALRGPPDISGSGPLADVETDLWFANDTQKSPDNDVILTLYNLQDGVYILRSYHNRSDEPPVPIKAFGVSGAGTAISVPVGDFWQNHDCMAEPPEIIFGSVGGGGVVIRYTGPDFADPNEGGSSPQVYFNGFTLEYLGPDMPFSSNPNPAKGTEQICPGVTLSWTPGAYATKHDIYFGDSMDDVNESADPCQQDYIGNTWKPTGLQLGATYFWRVDDVNDPNTWEGMVWYFTTNDGNAYDPVPANDWRGVSPSASLSWTPGCLAASHNIYFGTSLDYVDENADPCVTAHPSTTWTPSLDPLTTYYWRIEEVNGLTTWPGEVSTFKTGHSGGVLMYYKFDGSQGSALPSPITDDSGNSIQFIKYLDPNDANSIAEYGQSNPAINAETGASAEFVPSAGLYRLDTGENDILRLDGYQYTIEMWINPNSIPDIDDRKDPGAILIAKENFIDEDYESALVWSMELRLDRGVDFFHGGIFVGGDNTRQNMYISCGRNVIRTGEWYHIAGVFDLSDPSASQKLYVDGILVAAAARPDQNPPDPNRVGIGAMARSDDTFSDFYDGLIDELRITEAALGPDDFLLVPGPEWARNPSPHDKQRSIDPNVVLMWTPGDYADKHDIYIGTSFDNVGPGASAYATNVDGNSYYPGPLEWAATYYWRVDTVNDVCRPGNPWEGVVWRFTVKAKVEDPNLIVWYKFDESSGAFAQDSSGHELHGSVYGPKPESWEPNQGHIDGCLVYDDDISTLVQYGVAEYFNDQITIAVWLNGLYEKRGYDDMPVLDGGAIHDDLLEGSYALTALVPAEDGTVAWRAGNDTNDVLIWEQASPAGWRLEWHHFAFVKDEKTHTMTIYLDGLPVRQKPGTISSLGYALSGIVKLGAYTDNDSDYMGKMDDFKMFNRALSAKEIEAIFRGGDLVSAWGPEPYQGQIDTPYDANLIWRQGDLASSHEVYFGTNWDDVNDANNSWDVGTTVYKGKQDPNKYEPDVLQLGRTYYWRIDEVNDSNGHRWTGKLWRFTVADYITIDDMEDYDEIWDGWYYGWSTQSNSLLSLWKTAPVRGDQTMKFVYDNTIPFEQWYFSEAETITLDPNNWTLYDLRVLSLWFYGESDNATTGVEPMYVYLEDNSYNSAMVKYGDGEGEHPDDIAVEEWQNWEIFTSSLNDANQASLRALCIGFGEERFYWTAGGWGEVYFDDIRLYQPICIPERRPPEFAKLDLSRNCIVDWEDIEIMADDWLESDVNLGEVVKPDANGLVGWWKLDDGGGSVVTDYAGLDDHNGVIETLDVNVFWVDGRIDGNALEFDGGRVRVTDAPALKSMNQLTVCAWVKYPETHDQSARVVVKGADNKETFALEVSGDDELSFYVRDGNDPNLSSFPMYSADSNELDKGEWTHVAGTYDGNTVKSYVNGVLEVTNNDANEIAYFGHPLSQDTNDLAIGNRSDDDNRAFIGTIEDVRLYNYALSEEEIAYIATDTTRIFSVQSIANLYNDEDLGERAVNIRDFAVIANSWLVQRLWPE